MKPIRVIELFAGIGAQHQALKNLGIPHEVVAISEIDKSAILGYQSIHGETDNLGDITKIEHLPPCDLITYSFPCQDLSIAGNQKGMIEGSNTRSSLLWEVGRLLKDMNERNELPEFLLMENVDAILNEKNFRQFNMWIQLLYDLGYVSSYAVLNAKDYGIPQNRERCFMVSSLTHGRFLFPDKQPLNKCLKDVLEESVPDKYYLSEERIAKFEEHRIRSEMNNRGFGWKPIDLKTEKIAHSVTTNGDRHVENYVIIAGELNELNRFEHSRRIYSSDGVCATVVCNHDAIPKILVAGNVGSEHQHTTVVKPEGLTPTIAACDYKDPLKIIEKELKIRFLTPKECLRLMGFDDEEINKILIAVPQKTHQYRLAGNSIVVSCLESIFRGMFVDETFTTGTIQKSLLNFKSDRK